VFGAVAITGVHGLIYTSEPEALRATLRDVFEWPHVEDEPGWLIFALPPAELGVHPTMEPGERSHHELSLICDDLSSTVAELRAKGVEVRGEPQDVGWGIVTTVVLPGDTEVMLYEPRHRTAIR
jgi:Glyoxalase/Bleomycin resistance protein/Dioxygenase superfamily